MRLTINGKVRDVAAGATVDGLLRELGIHPERTGTAVARNDQVVPRDQWSRTPLAEGDRIEIIMAVQGG